TIIDRAREIDRFFNRDMDFTGIILDIQGGTATIYGVPVRKSLTKVWELRLIPRIFGHRS
ncbi:MAG: hypothetical protein K8F25_03825, partial [Fimbriimonadaceae bacterium]|nr:hypothetical protein [Alphaproteobacteria bacterium]